MQHWIDKLTDLAALRGDETILKDALSLFAEQAGFGGYAYHYIRPGHTVAASNYHPEWRALYFKGKFQTVDPIVNRKRQAVAVQAA
ncbi:Autoinducer binding domain protein [Rhizobium leguminosarum bv. trifolii WSM597]|uniref:Autoinducer binding domain protein n=1 Tax=Rhizobium leguminosarum bv. trifolii WSM597 TaxID=754764 RepID=I9XD88_RHILT|nr:autoinducer binding domain-containing protein [Rhizobium leguminosarum]EJB07036.1 Autoinducer binding domain protein [Rhizobium leguminosarum bv. trifolii WSM597]